ncbi:hypothetical protein Tco_0171483, partial [Tanacetum coccineum]
MPERRGLDPSLSFMEIQDEIREDDQNAQEAEAQANVKLVEQHLLDEEVNKIVEGDDSTI